MEELIKTLPDVLRFAGDEPEVASAAVFTAWKRAAGDGLRPHAIPLNFKDGTLSVAVADAVWQKQLSAMTAELIYKTNSILGHPLVKRVDLVQDPNLIKSSEKHTAKHEPKPEIPLDLIDAAKTIADERLRKIFIRAAAATLNQRQREQ